MPPALLRENIQTTPYSAVVRIVGGRVEPPDASSGYVRIIYQARVLETLKGAPRDALEYSAMAEAGFPVRVAPHPLIVSLCGTAETGFYVPDNGYESTATEELLEFARGAASSSSASTSACP